MYIRSLILDAFPGNPCHLIPNMCFLHIAFTHEGQKENNGKLNLQISPRTHVLYDLNIHWCVIWGKWGKQMYTGFCMSQYTYTNTPHTLYSSKSTAIMHHPPSHPVIILSSPVRSGISTWFLQLIKFSHFHQHSL
jgi:hypothetical protein